MSVILFQISANGLQIPDIKRTKLHLMTMSVIKFQKSEIKLLISANIFRYPELVAHVSNKIQILFIYLKISIKELQISKINCRHICLTAESTFTGICNINCRMQISAILLQIYVIL